MTPETQQQIASRLLSCYWALKHRVHPTQAPTDGKLDAKPHFPPNNHDAEMLNRQTGRHSYGRLSCMYAYGTHEQKCMMLHAAAVCNLRWIPVFNHR